MLCREDEANYFNGLRVVYYILEDAVVFADVSGVLVKVNFQNRICKMRRKCGGIDARDTNLNSYRKSLRKNSFRPVRCSHFILRHIRSTV